LRKSDTLIRVKAIVYKCINLYQFINNKYNLFYPASFSEQTVHTFMCLARGVHILSIQKERESSCQMTNNKFISVLRQVWCGATSQHHKNMKVWT